MSRWNQIVLPLALITMTAGIVLAEEGAAPPREGREGQPARKVAPDAPPPNSPSTMLQRLKEHLGDVGLTADQKAKVEELLARTTEEVKAAENKLQESMQAFRKDLAEILDEKQLRKVGELTRPPGRGQPGVEMVQRLRGAMEKLDLTADQKEKLKVLFDGVLEKARDLVEKNRDNPEEMRKAMQALFEDLRAKANEILTPEQREKLKAALQPKPKDGERTPGGDKPR